MSRVPGSDGKIRGSFLLSEFFGVNSEISVKKSLDGVVSNDQ